MDVQLDLFGPSRRTTRPPLPPHNRTRTSIAAAESVRLSAGTVKARVFEFIVQRGGATNYEIVDGLGLLLQSVCARVNELKTSGFVRDSGTTRPSPTGRQAIVWEPIKGGAAMCTEEEDVP